MPRPLVPLNESRAGVGPSGTLSPPPSHRLLSCRVLCCWTMQEEKGTSWRRWMRTRRSRSRMIIAGTGLLLWGGLANTLTFTQRAVVTGVGLPAKVNAASPVLSLSPTSTCAH